MDRIYNSTILIIDDDDDLRETYVDLLMFEGFENTYQAADGQIALETARSTKLDLIISDLNMPGMDGIETIKRIKEFQPSVSSMILTGFGSMDLAIKAFSESNVDDFLSKPVENEELIEKIKHHLSMKDRSEEVESSNMVRGQFGGQKNYFGQFLVDNNFITEDDLIDGLAKHKESGKMLGLVLVEMGIVTADELNRALAEFKGYPIASSRDFQSIQTEVVGLVPEAIAKKNILIPLAVQGDELSVAMINPDDLQVTDTLKMISKKTIVPYLATEEQINKAISETYTKIRSSAKASSALSDIFGEDEDIDIKEIADDVDDEEVGEGSSAVVRLVNSILQKADIDGTSDIHIEPLDNSMQIRFRKDGNLYIPEGYGNLPKKLHPSIVARVKVLTKTMKIDVKLRPQDGKIRLKIAGRKIDFRVGSLPTVHGEKVVLRLLKSEALFPIEDIFSNNQTYIDTFTRNIKRKDGMVLVTGPTGSGKTNTLQSALNHIKDVSLNITSVEDPVEMENPGVNQVQVNEQQGLTFSGALRQILRQDPDVVLIGEMRDYETAHIGCEAALTGHLVFSTLHTNDAPSTVTRFIEMGLKDYLIATVVHLVLAQRLARRICKMCKKEFKYDPAQLRGIGFTDEEINSITLYKGEGCPNCKGTGQAGRVAIVEMLELTDKIRTAIMEKASTLEIARLGKEEGTYFTLKEDALRMFKAGIIDLKEALKYMI